MYVLCACYLGAEYVFCGCFAAGAHDVQVDVAHVLHVHARESGTVGADVGDAVRW